MPIEKQLKRTEWNGPIPTCICSREPKAYCRDGLSFHVECNICQIFTVPLSNINSAAREFVRVCSVVRQDRMPKGVSVLEAKEK